MRGIVIANEPQVVQRLALNGDGIALLPSYFFVRDVRARKIVRVLPQWHSPESPMHFVYPPQKFDVPKRSAFIDLALPVLQRSFRGE
jgi:DNA-binding transcriptional LysR family regulator